MLKLDHVIIGVHDLTQAIEDYARLGFTVIPGGTHSNGATWNALIIFRDGSYLELLAPTGNVPRGDSSDFSFLIQEDEGISGFALYADHLSHEVDAMRRRGVSLGSIKTGGRRRADGIELRWQTSSPVSGFSPFLLQDISPRNLRVPDDAASITHANTVTGIAGLVLGMENADISNAITYYTMLTGITAVTDYQVYGYVKLNDLVISVRPPRLERKYPDALGHVPEEIVLTVDNAEVDHRLFDPAQTHGVRFSLSKS